MSELERDQLWPLARVLGPIIGVEVDESRGMTMLVSTTDDETGAKVFADGAFEAGALDRACSRLTQLNRPLMNRRFVDVGAHTGSVSVLATVKHRAVDAVAFEPDPHNYRILCANVALNGSEVLTVPSALGDAPGPVWLTRNATNHGASRISLDATEGSIRVAMRTFDEVATEHEIDPYDVGLAWVDVGGAELCVLRGATQLLDRCTPLVLKFGPELTGDRCGALVELLDQAEYQHVHDLCVHSWQSPRAVRNLGPLQREMTLAGRRSTSLLVI